MMEGARKGQGTAIFHNEVYNYFTLKTMYNLDEFF